MDLNTFSNELLDSEEVFQLISKKPSTRIEACQFLAKIKALKEKVEGMELPKELDPEFEIEEPELEDQVEEIMGRFNRLISDLSEGYAKAETLCVCWNKLDSDFSELTSALNNGGASKLTVDRLEQSITALKEMFAERTSLLATISTADESTAAAAEEDY